MALDVSGKVLFTSGVVATLPITDEVIECLDGHPSPSRTIITAPTRAPRSSPYVPSCRDVTCHCWMSLGPMPILPSERQNASELPRLADQDP